MAELMLGVSHHLCGNQILAQEHCEQGLRRVSGEVRTTFFGYDHRVRALVALCRTLWLRGLSDRAVTVAHEAINEAAKLNRPVDVCISLIYSASVYVWRGDWMEATRVVDMLAEHAARHSLAPYQAVAMAMQGELLVRTGRPEEGCVLLKDAASALEAERHAILATVFAGALAEGLAATGAIDAALATVEDALVETKRRGASFDQPELLRLKGTLLASQYPADERTVNEHIHSAIELARRQGALGWELRAVMSLARENLRRGRSVEDFRRLAAVCSQFKEGLETADLREAAALLGSSPVL
jgi:predicted ATPase